MRRVLAKYCRPTGGSDGLSWLTFLGHAKDSLWSVDLIRCESPVLKAHWVMVVMDQIGGMSVAEHPLRTKQCFSYIPESVSLYGSLSGLDNLEYFVALGGRKIARAQLSDILVETGLAPQAIHRKVSTYSKGMRQRVGIALAVAKRSRALLLDEPTSGLDPRACHEFADLLRRMSGEGVAILMTTHDLFNAKECGTHVGILHRGQLVDSAELADLSAIDLEKRFLKATETPPPDASRADAAANSRVAP